MIKKIMIFLIFFCSMAYAGAYQSDENMNFLENSVYNATYVNSTYIYQNGSALLSSQSDINASRIINPPSACPSYSAISAFNTNFSSATCSDWWVDINGDTWTGNMITGGNYILGLGVKPYDVVVCRTTDTGCDVTCSDDDCYDEFVSAFQKINNTGEGSMLIKGGTYPIQTDLTVKLNISKLTIHGYGATLKGMAAGTTLMSFYTMNVSESKFVQYDIRSITFDMNNLADVGLVMFNPHHSTVDGITVSNRGDGAFYWMINFWCAASNNGEFCYDNTLKNSKFINSTDSNYEAITITRQYGMVLDNVMCKNVNYRCIIDYKSVKSNFNNIRDESESDENESGIFISVYNYDTKITNMDAPLGAVELKYAWSPYTEGYLKLFNSKLKYISSWSNFGFCRYGVGGEDPFWCNSTVNYTAKPEQVVIKNNIFNSTGTCMALLVGYYNDSYDWSYIKNLIIKDNEFYCGTSNTLNAEEIILQGNTFINQSYLAAGYLHYSTIFTNKFTVESNVGLGNKAAHSIFKLDEGANHTAGDGNKYYKNSSTVWGDDNSYATFTNNMFKDKTSTLVRYSKDASWSLDNYTDTWIIQRDNTLLLNYDTELEFNDEKTWTSLPASYPIINQPILYTDGYTRKICFFTNASTWMCTLPLTTNDKMSIPSGSSTKGIYIENDGSNYAMHLDQDGDNYGLLLDTAATTSTKYGLYVTASKGAKTSFFNQAANTSAMRILKSATGAGTTVEIENDGTGYSLLANQDGNGVGIFIDSEATSKAGLEIAMANSGYTGIKLTTGLMDANSNDIINADDINATEFYQGGNKVLDTTDNTSTYTYIDAQDTAFNDSIKAYLDSQDTVFNDSIKAYSDNAFITQANEGNLDVNRSDYWDDHNTASDLNNLIESHWDNITNKFITAVDDVYIYMSGTTLTLNETKLNESIRLIDTATNTSMKNYVDAQDTTYNSSIKSYLDAQDTSFNTSIADYVDSLISGLSSVYCALSGCTMTSTLSISNDTNISLLDLDKTGLGTGNVIDINNDGTGSGLFVKQDGLGKGIYIDQNANEYGMQIITDATTITKYGLYVLANEGAKGVLFYQGANTSALRIQKTAVGSGEVVEIENDGTGHGLFLNQDGNGTALYIESNSTSEPGIYIADMPSNESITIQTNDKICLNGVSCSVWIAYNGTCIATSSGNCI